ncbi:hypothetical protein QO021_29050 (plasmid) [Pseudomonas amygdali pv. lachrymans]|uniref:hypothetical protein n=1 Tax=Pseudomonas amygdali TaxID=47877 RepID=UPI0006B8FF96|nr:hypothetical protein [Pseudomonas amygdali]RMM39452.1 hypothetical protein ALQ79_200750 [Pseudomonas amygdali pv. lachrymans]WIO61608.1 hypothetical protein QO021_29050 [Pseudomonas amygdali pv. lachrymans]
MNRRINQAVIQHLINIEHRDLNAGSVTPRLVEAAGQAIADVLLDHGYQLESSYRDGRDVVHCYINPRTGEILDDIGFTLDLMDDGMNGPNLAVLLRTEIAHTAPPFGFTEALRTARSWYLPMSDTATAHELFSVAGALKFEACFEWRAAA